MLEAFIILLTHSSGNVEYKIIRISNSPSLGRESFCDLFHPFIASLFASSISQLFKFLEHVKVHIASCVRLSKSHPAEVILLSAD